eukprot:scaffold1112_cov92-Amphora_coffeaeformis.AAC.24
MIFRHQAQIFAPPVELEPSISPSCPISPYPWSKIHHWWRGKVATILRIANSIHVANEKIRGISCAVYSTSLSSYVSKGASLCSRSDVSVKRCSFLVVGITRALRPSSKNA